MVKWESLVKDKQFAFNMYIKKTFNTTLIYMFYIFEGNNKDKINSQIVGILY